MSSVIAASARTERAQNPKRARAAGRWLVTILAVSFPVAPLNAQTITGETIDQTTAEPLRGVFVALIGPDGERVAGVLTDEAGRFRLRAPEPGHYTLRADRIGYETVHSATLELGPGVTTHRFQLPSRTIRLVEVVVEADARECRLRPEEGTRVQEVWDQARMATEIASWTEESRHLRFEGVRYERLLDPVSRRVLEERVRRGTATGGTAFDAPPADEVITEGFVRATGDQHIFSGLDAATIFSDAFLNEYCFRIRRGDRDRKGLVGLAFEPARRRQVVDVRGVLWLDEATSELRTVEYTYTSLPYGLPTDRFGGETEFRRLPSGAWIVQRWSIRMPQLERVPSDRPDPLRRGRDPLARLRDQAGLVIKEDAGEVTAIYTTAGMRLPGPERAALHGIVRDSVSGRPLAGARVMLEGTVYHVETDERGRYRFDDLPHGVFAVTFEHAVLDSLGVEPPTADVVLARGDLTAMDLAVPAPVPTPEAQVTRSDAANVDRVAGTILDAETGMPVRGASVRLAGTGLDQVTDAAGRFVFRQVPAGEYELRAEHVAYMPVADTIRVAGAGRQLQVDVRLGTRAVPLDPVVVSVSARPTRGLLGTVYDRIERVRLTGGGTVFDRADIERRNPVRFTHLLSQVPGVRLERFVTPGDVDTRDVQILVSTRGTSAWGPCPMTIYIDGNMVIRGGAGGFDAGDSDINRLIAVSHIEAVEVYHPGQQMPPEYWGSWSACGVVLIWTQRGT